MKSALFVLAASAAAIGLSACGGGSNNPPAPGPTCSPPSGTQTALVYPAPGATAVPDQFGQVIIGASPALPSSWNVVLVRSSTGGSLGGNTFTGAPQPLPTPNAIPAFANPVYQSSSFGSLVFGGLVLQVYLNNTASNCTPMGPIGSFTTQ